MQAQNLAAIFRIKATILLSAGIAQVVNGQASSVKVIGLSQFQQLHAL